VPADPELLGAWLGAAGGLDVFDEVSRLLTGPCESVAPPDVAPEVAVLDGFWVLRFADWARCVLAGTVDVTVTGAVTVWVTTWVVRWRAAASLSSARRVNPEPR
jgi:hypothetical protein